MFREGVTTRKNGSHSVVWYHSVEYPKADHLINRWVVGRAKCLRVARQPLSPAERKKERESSRGGMPSSLGREREREREKREQFMLPPMHSVWLVCYFTWLPQNIWWGADAPGQGVTPLASTLTKKRERERQREREREREKKRERERWGQLSSSGAHSS